MNGTDDCGKAQGNGKNNLSGYNNTWIFEGMSGGGQTLNCTPDELPPTSSCELALGPMPSCATEGKPTSLTFLVEDNDCVVTNSQSGKATCSGDFGRA
jgi:hypothetical protein